MKTNGTGASPSAPASHPDSGTEQQLRQLEQKLKQLGQEKQKAERVHDKEKAEKLQKKIEELQRRIQLLKQQSRKNTKAENPEKEGQSSEEGEAPVRPGFVEYI